MCLHWKCSSLSFTRKNVQLMAGVLRWAVFDLPGAALQSFWVTCSTNSFGSNVDTVGSNGPLFSLCLNDIRNVFRVCFQLCVQVRLQAIFRTSVL